jgi:hypothetical protein
MSVSNVSINTNDVIAFLQGASLGGMVKQRLLVGYSAEHAVYVHEDLTANHPNGGQAKYLESVIRDPSVLDLVRQSIRKDLKNKRSLREALINAGNIILRASMPLVPVDTGELVNSGFVDVQDI